ncbi:MAG TPA: TldD/PmbA family protein [Planctomycetota bacterium]|nr:TldD/PmbA family protein [Planctomycetota bacterium]
MKELANVALNAARTGGASYADIRISRHRDQAVHTREDRVQSVSDAESFGFGVRVLLDGAWGFAASHRVEKDAIADAAARALAMARANKAALRRPVELAPTDAFMDTWRSPVEKDPFAVPVGEKAELLLAVNAAVLKVQGAKYVNSFMLFRNEWKLFASTEGSVIEQDITRVWPCFTVTAIDADKGEFQTRTAEVPPRSAGYEHVEGANLVELAPRMAEEAVRKLTAKSVEPGRRDLVLHPTNLWLTIHESVGHPTELDRVIGQEANYAGTSFLTPDKLGKLNYGSDLVSFRADRTIPGGMATCGYDDDGVKTEEWHLVKDGLFVDYQTTREQVLWPEYRDARQAAGLPEATRSHGAAYADSWGSIPFQRNVNIHLEPGKKPLTPDELIASTDDGILIRGDSSYSIDHQRYNFQFSGQVFFEIKGGKVTQMLRDVAYQSNTVEFWNSCDAICDERFWAMGATYYCGKGQPSQCSPCSHGAAPARFRNVNVLNTKREV